MKNYIKKRLKSFKFAFNGIGIMIKEETNAKVYVVLSIIALLLGYLLHISSYEWIVICAVIGFVFAMEAANTAIENLADYASNKEIHPIIKKVKDLGAAAVLFAAIVSLIAGIIIFLPKILSL
ncbi:MAG: diacylglycerol kinase family protein [Candidatus Saccharimonadaceae bacterium]